jgi:hypothetical protein
MGADQISIQMFASASLKKAVDHGLAEIKPMQAPTAA